MPSHTTCISCKFGLNKKDKKTKKKKQNKKNRIEPTTQICYTEIAPSNGVQMILYVSCKHSSKLVCACVSVCKLENVRSHRSDGNRVVFFKPYSVSHSSLEKHVRKDTKESKLPLFFRLEIYIEFCWCNFFLFFLSFIAASFSSFFLLILLVARC